MTTYICKCGRQVKKATNADNTGNRDTQGCKGCPYLLPWGPDKYIEGQGFTKDVQGDECRMSPTISYTTTYRGQANDKCTLHILSLDLDFLDEVQAWIYDNAADTLSAGFSRGSMRGTDFSNKGRYSLSISCAQNKKGMAAKAALIEHFFTSGRVRKDMTLVQEKAHILASIKKGKENASKMNYIISEHSNGLLYAYYKGLFWFWHKDQNKWVPSDFARLKYEQAKAKDGKITPEDILDNGEFFALEEYQVPLKLRTALEALTPADSKIPAPDAEGAGAKECPANAEESCLTVICPEYIEKAIENPTAAAVDVPPCAPTASDAQTSPCQSADADAKTGAEESVENPTPAAPASRADAGAAEQGLSAAGPVSLEAKDMNVPTFDYDGLDLPTRDALRWAEKEIREARRDYIVRLAQAVYFAHDALCATAVQNLDTGKFSKPEDSFQRWCESVGIKRSTAYNLLQVQMLLSSSTTEEQATLEAASPSLLYAAAKPSAPAELVQAVKDGDITTHKQYQEALAEIRARDAKINDLLEMSEAADRRAEEAERMRQDAQQKCEEAIANIEVARNMQIDTARERDEARRREAKADARAREAEEENSDLRRRLQEMEERPRDVAVMQPGEEQIEAWRREGAERLADTVKDQVSRANKDKLDAQRQVADLQKQLEESRPDADACQRTVDILYETTENLRLLLRSQLKQARLSPNAYGKVVAHVLQAARNLMDTVRVCSPDGYDMDSEEDDDFE